MKTELQNYLSNVAYEITQQTERLIGTKIDGLSWASAEDLISKISNINGLPFFIGKSKAGGDGVLRYWDDATYQMSFLYAPSERCGWFFIWYKNSAEVRANDTDWFNAFQRVQNVMLAHKLWDFSDIDSINDDPGQTLINGLTRHAAEVAALKDKLKAAVSIVRDISYQRTALEVLPEAYIERMKAVLK